MVRIHLKSPPGNGVKMANFNILVVNAGSSSIKLALYRSEGKRLLSKIPLWKKDTELAFQNEGNHLKSVEEAIKRSLASALKSDAIPALSEIHVVGHRVVHGGSDFTAPVFIDTKVKKTIDSLTSLAPLHNPVNYSGILATEKMVPNAKQIAVFDTAFFTTLPEYAYTYPGPYKWKTEKIRRYGFHGISHHYNSLRYREMIKTKKNTSRIISCHLGNGASLAAIKNGKCIDTTMGFTPLDGLMMGTRSGALDPGILTYLMTNKKMSAKTLQHQLNYDSGLKGISGVSGDMREILALRAQKDQRAILAYEMYVHSLEKYIAAMGASLEGIDAILFSGGIGENSWQIRNDAIESLKWFGIELDEKINRRCTSDRIISTDQSKVKVAVITSEEDWMIANSCRLLLS